MLQLRLRALAFALALGTTTLAAQTRTFGDLAAGPYNRLVIRGAMVIPGHGGPPAGPYDILIEGNTITQMVPFDPVAAERRGAGSRLTGDRVIDAGGMYVLPGMIDLHTHIRSDPMEMEYVYYLKLAHGVTTMVNAADRGYAHAMREARRSKANEILAPRMFPLVGWGTGTTATPRERDDPARVPTIMKAMADSGLRVISMDPLGWSPALVGAIAQEAKKHGMITSFHIPPSTIAVLNAVQVACLGVTMIEHHYAYAESALPRTTQDFGREYSFSNENDRFRYAGKVWLETDRQRLLTEVADSLVKCGVTMLPTRVVYEANRDFHRASSLPWHEKYTHQSLWNWNLPNPAYHGSFHYEWTSDDEYYWTYAFRLWGDLIFEFNKRGGRVAYGTDDNYIWATPGFSSIRELQLLRETGMHSLEVIKAATYNSALTLGEPKLGLVRPGYLADLAIVDGNPAYNLKFMYGFGDLRLDRDGRMIRTKGIVHTIKDGVVTNNARLLEEVEKMVARSKANMNVDPVIEPFVQKGAKPLPGSRP
jgi:hypothetical protein